MKKLMPYILDYYDREVTAMIVRKYGWQPMTALRKYLESKTAAMMRDVELEMWEYGVPYIFDMWEVEQLTGDPRNSRYIRGCADVA